MPLDDHDIDEIKSRLSALSDHIYDLVSGIDDADDTKFGDFPKHLDALSKAANGADYELRKLMEAFDAA